MHYGTHGQQIMDAMDEKMHDNTVSPIPDQAAFRIDFPKWLRTLTPRERRIIGMMVQDETTKELSHRFKLSPGRISQLRRELCRSWESFHGDKIPA
jgi:DNA-directed RNA polymerase sigma subunit (sigma70/sigma32)